MHKRYTFHFQNGTVTIDPEDEIEDNRILCDLYSNKNPLEVSAPEGDLFINPLTLNFVLRADRPEVQPEPTKADLT